MHIAAGSSIACSQKHQACYDDRTQSAPRELCGALHVHEGDCLESEVVEGNVAVLGAGDRAILGTVRGSVLATLVRRLSAGRQRCAPPAGTSTLNLVLPGLLRGYCYSRCR